MQGLGREGQRHCREEGLVAVRLCLGVPHSVHCSVSDSPRAVSFRNCPTEIILLVWRLVPQVKSGHDGMIRRSSCKSAYDLQSPPNKREKNSTMPPRAEQRRSCHVLYDGSDGLVLNGWERYTEIGKPSPNTMPPLSRVPSAADQNYIILAPLNPGSQVGRPSSPALELLHAAVGCACWVLAWPTLMGHLLYMSAGALAMFLSQSYLGEPSALLLKHLPPGL